jgi:hypothetical protein
MNKTTGREQRSQLPRELLDTFVVVLDGWKVANPHLLLLSVGMPTGPIEMNSLVSFKTVFFYPSVQSQSRVAYAPVVVVVVIIAADQPSMRGCCTRASFLGDAGERNLGGKSVVDCVNCLIVRVFSVSDYNLLFASTAEEDGSCANVSFEDANKVGRTARWTSHLHPIAQKHRMTTGMQ